MTNHQPNSVTGLAQRIASWRWSMMGIQETEKASLAWTNRRRMRAWLRLTVIESIE